MTDKGRKRLALILMWASALIMIIHLSILDYDNADISDLWSPISNILLIIAMYTVIRDINKKVKH